jgi:hypothetical protein
MAMSSFPLIERPCVDIQFCCGILPKVLKTLPKVSNIKVMEFARVST